VKIQEIKILFLKSGVPENVFQRDPAIPSDMLVSGDLFPQNQKDGVEVVHRVRRRADDNALFCQNIPKRKEEHARVRNVFDNIPEYDRVKKAQI
jgi:hypothetical protein